MHTIKKVGVMRQTHSLRKLNRFSEENKRLRRVVKFLFSFLFFAGLFFSVYSLVSAAYITNPPNEDAQQWKLDDNAANTTVIGNQLNGTLVGGNTSDVASTVNGYPAFHLNGSTQYVQVPTGYPTMRSDEIANLWTKYSGNPVLVNTPVAEYGQLAKNPSGGWYWFGSDATNIYRWQSSDLITWTDKTLILSAAGVGAWDHNLQVATAFQKISDGSWILLYRGFNGSTYRVGLATSSDGTTFTRKDNGGVNDGLFPQFGTNYDTTTVMLVGSTYYVYLNGSPDHSHTNIYTSTDDFATFTPYANNPVFNNGFCSNVWSYGGYYYALVPRDLGASGSTLYDHGIALYRSTVPTFDADTRQYLGYAVINDKSYDAYYLDTPSVPMTDVYRTTYAPEFGDTLYMLYGGGSGSLGNQVENLAYTTFSQLSSLTPITEAHSEINHNAKTYSFWVQFDSLTAGDPVFSVGSIPTDGSPVWLGVIKTSGSNKVLSFFLGGGYKNTSLALTINTPYHIVVVDEVTDKKVYINNSLVGTFTEYNNAVDDGYLYIGKGYGTQFLDGFVWDFREYSKDLTVTEVASLYSTGSIDITAPSNPTLSSLSGYTKDNTRPTLIFKKSTDSGGGISSYSVNLDSGKNKSYSTSGIPASGNGSSSYTWKDDNDVKIEFLNENDSDSGNDEIRVYFKGLNSDELTEGKHTWTVTTHDANSNSTTQSTDFYIDRTNPSISELAIADVSIVNSGMSYKLNTTNRMPSFSGLATDTYQGSTVTNSNGTKDTFDKVSSGPKTITLTLERLKDGEKSTSQNATYIDYLSKEFSLTDITNIADDKKFTRFFITTPFPLIDGYYKVQLSLKDEAGNTYDQPAFYLSLNSSQKSTPKTLLTGQNLETEIIKQETTPAKTEEEKAQVQQEGYNVKIKVVDTKTNPVKGAKVTIHSKVQETTTDENGIAQFSNVEPGDHQVIIAYNNYEGEQKISLTGDVKEFSFTIQVKETAPFSNNIERITIIVMGIVIVGLTIFIYRARKTKGEKK